MIVIDWPGLFGSRGRASESIRKGRGPHAPLGRACKTDCFHPLGIDVGAYCVVGPTQGAPSGAGRKAAHVAAFAGRNDWMNSTTSLSAKLLDRRLTVEPSDSRHSAAQWSPTTSDTSFDIFTSRYPIRCDFDSRSQRIFGESRPTINCARLTLIHGLSAD